jgi:hypothetical protein
MVVIETRDTGCEQLEARIARGVEPCASPDCFVRHGPLWFVGTDEAWVFVAARPWEPFSVVDMQIKLRQDEQFYLRLAAAFGSPWAEFMEPGRLHNLSFAQMAELQNLADEHGGLFDWMMSEPVEFWRELRDSIDG